MATRIKKIKLPQHAPSANWNGTFEFQAWNRALPQDRQLAKALRGAPLTFRVPEGLRIPGQKLDIHYQIGAEGVHVQGVTAGDGEGYAAPPERPPAAADVSPRGAGEETKADAKDKPSLVGDGSAGGHGGHGGPVGGSADNPIVGVKQPGQQLGPGVRRCYIISHNGDGVTVTPLPDEATAAAAARSSLSGTAAEGGGGGRGSAATTGSRTAGDAAGAAAPVVGTGTTGRRGGAKIKRKHTKKHKKHHKKHPTKKHHKKRPTKKHHKKHPTKKHKKHHKKRQTKKHR
jgi:hypothetical protein